MYRYLLYRAWRAVAGLTRPTARANRARLRERGEAIDQLHVRAARVEDAHQLAELHVRTWNDTYRPLGMRGPSTAVREQQWIDRLARPVPGSFCLLVQHPDGHLVGFVEGRPLESSPTTAELHKLYLEREYQRLGLGRRLFDMAVERFIAGGFTSMQAYVDPRNPSCAFWETVGGKHLRGASGETDYSWYTWHLSERPLT